MDLSVVKVNLPLENAAVHLAARNEKQTIVAEEAVRDKEKMVGVALVVGFTFDVRVVEKTNRAHFVGNHNDWFAQELAYF